MWARKSMKSWERDSSKNILDGNLLMEILIRIWILEYLIGEQKLKKNLKNQH